VALALLYRPALDCPFFYDEKRLILPSPQVQAGTPWAAFRLNPSRGLPMATFAATYARAGEDPAAWRATQVALHGLTAVLLALLLRLHLRDEPRRAAIATAYGVALLFALHPLAVESAVYVWSRGSVLYTQFALLAAMLAVLAVRQPTPRRRWIGFGLGVPFLSLAGLSKAAGIIPAAGVWFGTVLAGDRRRALLLLAAGTGLGLLAVLVGWTVLTETFEHTLHGLRIRLQDRTTLTKHLWTQTAGFLLYLRLLVPWPGQYAVTHLVEPPATGTGFLGILAMLVLAGGMVWAALRGRVLAATGGALLFFAFLPYLVVPSRAVVEYKAYPILAGAALLLAAGLRRLAPARRARPGVWIALGVAAVACAAVTWGQARTWTDPLSVWRQALVAHSDNPEPKTALAYDALQRAEAAYERRDRPAYDRALDEMGEYLKLAARNIQAIHERSGPLVKNNWCWTFDLLALWFKRRGRLDLAEGHWKQALAFNPDYVPAMYNLAGLLLQQNRHAEAREFYQMARAHIHDPYEQQLVQQLAPYFPDAAP